MAGPDKPRPPTLTPDAARREARLAQALRSNLRRRKAPPATPSKPSETSTD